MAIVAALVTGVFTLIAQLIASGKSLRRKPDSLRLTWRIVLGTLIVVVGSVSMFFFVHHLITHSPQATITAPRSSATPAVITARSTIEGSANYLPHDQLFIVLRSTGGGGLQYYPQAQVSTWTGADWSAALEAPGPGSYDLLAVAATTPEASGELQMYIEICKTTACPGVNPSPEGMETLASVPVTIP
jgi:hypothetical protein